MQRSERYKTTNSERGAYRTCPHRWRMQYVQRLSPPRRWNAMELGTAVHVGVAAAWEGRQPEGALSEHLAAWESEARQQGVDCAPMHEAAPVAAWAMRRLIDGAAEEMGRHRVIAVEVPFEATLTGRYLDAGVIDVVTWDPDAREIVIWDHKTTSGDVLAVEHKLQVDTQSAGYIHAARQALRPGAPLRLQAAKVGVPSRGRLEVSAFRWDIVRTKIPSTPKVNQNGTVSTAAIDTTADVYAAALEAQDRTKLKPETEEKQQEILARLRARGDSWYAKVDHYVSEEQIRRWRRDTLEQMKLMRRAEQDARRAYRNPLACTLPGTPSCAFREPCIVPDVLEHSEGLYEVRTKRHPEMPDTP